MDRATQARFQKLTTLNTDKVHKFGLMEHDILEAGVLVKQMVLEFSITSTAILLKVTFLRIRRTGKVLIGMFLDKGMKVIGWMIFNTAPA